ncbi:uncharacterized protein BYT42DRAFT_627335 [Radiomyces spectabilis]|uniref:uncharacterized protein n=1 Tax=Radiomyces spectabilis TaxID=64574 RepID=UPI00221FAA58|nr:uncharacterized protein BYT42DRAFT_627335 [Radiomyces spectabilis]KAI8365369.1 hypothetical protein BYT42DRAFT_627335 [Radiomyces spectabilis]
MKKVVSYYREVRSAEIPTAFARRNKWIKVFEILCYLFIGLKEQEEIYKAMEEEGQDAIAVIPEDTIRATLRENSPTLSSYLFRTSPLSLHGADKRPKIIVPLL